MTSAVIGFGAMQHRSPHVPRSPQHIGESAIAAAKAMPAIVLCLGRDPETGAARLEPKMFCDVATRMRVSSTDVVSNLKVGRGGDVVFGHVESPMQLNLARTDLDTATELVRHVVECRPKICTQISVENMSARVIGPQGLHEKRSLQKKARV